MVLKLKKVLETYQLHINVVGMVALASMAYVYPFDSSFRFTIGCALLATMLLYFRQLPIISTMVCAGAAIFVLRSGVHFLLGYQGWETVLFNNLPAVLYYVVLGLLWHVLDVRASADNMPLTILKLSVADIVSNVAEVAVRTDLLDDNYEMVAIGLVAVGVVRGNIWKSCCASPGTASVTARRQRPKTSIAPAENAMKRKRPPAPASVIAAAPPIGPSAAPTE